MKVTAVSRYWLNKRGRSTEDESLNQNTSENRPYYAPVVRIR